jgi:hypothetical protein
VVLLAADPEVQAPVAARDERVDPVLPHRQSVHDHAPALEAPPVEAREGHDPPGVPRREGGVGHDVADVEHAAVPREPERAEQPGDDLPRPGAGARDEPHAVGRRRLEARGGRPQPPAAVEGEVARMRDAPRRGLHPHAAGELHLPRGGRRDHATGEQDQHDEPGHPRIVARRCREAGSDDPGRAGRGAPANGGR